MKSTSSISSSDSNGAIHFALECVLFSALLLGLHALAYILRGPTELPGELAQLDRVIEENRTQVVYMGDSTLFMGRAGESDSRSTPQMLQEILDNTTVAEISGPAATIELHELLAKYLARRPSSIRQVIIPLNLRMLAPQLEDRSYRYFDRERLFVEYDSVVFRILYRPMAIFKSFDIRTAGHDELQMAPVLDGDVNLGPLGEFNPALSMPVTPEQRAHITAFSYMYALQEDSAALRRISSTIGHLQSAGITPIFYVTPVDVDACVRDLGPRAALRIRDNADVLVQHCVDAGAICIDLSASVPSEHFAWQHYPNEHLDATGRDLIARVLAAEVRRLQIQAR